MNISNVNNFNISSQILNNFNVPNDYETISNKSNPNLTREESIISDDLHSSDRDKNKKR